MFKMILAELKYFMSLFIIIYVISLYLFIWTFLKESNGYGLIISTSILFFFSVMILGGGSSKEKRNRFDALLPLSVKTIAKTSLLFLILFKASFFILWIVAYFARYIWQDPGLIWTMISMTMFNLILFGLLMIGGGLSYYGIRPRISIFVISLIIVILLFTTIINNIRTYQFEFIEIPLLEAFIELFKSPAGSLMMSITAGIFLYLGYIVTINRRSNLN
jgi:hypothetical protein